MKSLKPGKSISVAEVSHISAHGFWLLIADREYFLPFNDYPWFKDAKVCQILRVELHHGHHLHWPDLDVDLELESLAEPERYPLTYKPLTRPPVQVRTPHLARPQQSTDFRKRIVAKNDPNRRTPNGANG